jgi:glycosyltransferase involved in cell wall biosynthesis
VEAQACGCPVVASDVEPHPEVSGGAARLCRVDDADAFAEAVLDLEDDAPSRAMLVAAGFANVERFTLERTTARFLELYRAAA